MKKKHLQLGLLVLVFLVPPLVSYLLFFSGYRPEGSVHHGELVSPARPVTNDAGLNIYGGDGFSFAGPPRKWTLFYLAGNACGAVCEEGLYQIQQVRLAQGREMGRVRSITVLRDDAPEQEIARVRRGYPAVTVVLAPQDTYEGLADQFQRGEGSALQGDGRIYIVDPNGNIMMSYPPGSDPTGMRKDLKRLLKVSKIG
jgi:hypothetical protein